MSKLFFLGAGKMATAIAGGLVKAGTFQESQSGGSISECDRHPLRYRRL